MDGEGKQAERFWTWNELDAIMKDWNISINRCFFIFSSFVIDET